MHKEIHCMKTDSDEKNDSHIDEKMVEKKHFNSSVVHGYFKEFLLLHSACKWVNQIRNKRHHIVIYLRGKMRIVSGQNAHHGHFASKCSPFCPSVGAKRRDWKKTFNWIFTSMEQVWSILTIYCCSNYNHLLNAPKNQFMEAPWKQLCRFPLKGCVLPLVTLPLFPHTDVSPCRLFFPLPMFHRTDVSPYRCFRVPMFPRADASPYRCFTVPMFPRTDDVSPSAFTLKQWPEYQHIGKTLAMFEKVQNCMKISFNKAQCVFLT